MGNYLEPLTVAFLREDHAAHSGVRGNPRQHNLILGLDKDHPAVNRALPLEGPIAHLVLVFQHHSANQALMRQRRAKRLSLVHAKGDPNDAFFVWEKLCSDNMSVSEIGAIT